MTIEDALVIIAKYSSDPHYQADVYMAKKVIEEVMTRYISGVSLEVIKTSFENYINTLK